MALDYQDHGKKPYVVNIEKLTKKNENFRTTIWTGEKLQLTVMSIEPGDEIGLEVHQDIDQFLRIEKGKGLCKMGPSEDNLNFEQVVEEDDAIFVPAGTWHNIINIGDKPLKLYSIYAGPEHLPGTIHVTHDDARNDPHHQHEK